MSSQWAESLPLPAVPIPSPPEKGRDLQGRSFRDAWGGLPAASILDVCVAHASYPWASAREVDWLPGPRRGPKSVKIVRARPPGDEMLLALFSRVSFAHMVWKCAEDFAARAFANKPFLCAHWRRGDFRSFCPNSVCYVSAASMATQIATLARHRNLSHVFLTSNAADHEVRDLRNELASTDPSLKLHTLAHGEAKDCGLRFANAKATLSQALCVFADSALLNSYSSFSATIENLRWARGKGESWPESSVE